MKYIIIVMSLISVVTIVNQSISLFKIWYKIVESYMGHNVPTNNRLSRMSQLLRHDDGGIRVRKLVLRGFGPIRPALSGTGTFCPSLTSSGLASSSLKEPWVGYVPFKNSIHPA